MQIVLDLLLLAVFGLFVFIGWWRGFLKAVLGLGRLILSVILTILLGPGVSAWIDRTFINPPVYEAIHKKLTELATEVANTAQGGVDALTEKIPAMFKDYVDLENVNPAADVYALADEWSLSVAGGISKVIATVIGYILLFALCFVILTVLIFIMGKLVDRIRFIRTTDKVLGLILGVANGALIVLLVSTILGAILPLMGQEGIVDQSFMIRLSAGIRNLIFK
jgi:uncharacterized membrane protein required for colicin V production